MKMQKIILFVKLNLVINGKGTVWIDDIRLLKGQL